MRKFDETMLENQNWKDIGIQGKWTPVVIESPYCIDYDDTISMIMRCDYLFSNSEYAGGNDRDWNKMLRSYARLPDDFPRWIDYSKDKEFWTKANEMQDAAFDKVRKEWNRNPVDYSDLQVFAVNLFSSAYYKGPYSFVNFATGQVGLMHNIGKWPGSIGNCAEELEWFAKTYPLYKFFVTFCDEDYNEDKDEFYIKPLVTLMLWNGEIKVVTTRTRKEWGYVENINQFKGSTCAKRPSALHRFVWNKTKLWKITTALSIRRKIIHPLVEMFWESKFAKKYLHDARNERIIQHNDKITFGLDHEKYFDRAHAISVIDDWSEMLRRNK